MFATINSLGLLGINAYPVTMEVDITKGMPGFDIVGLPDMSIRESRDRVRSTMKNCGYAFPVNKITINLAPADLPKTGSLYDLPLLVGMLFATGQLKADVKHAAFVGELSLKGDVRSISGVLPMVVKAKKLGLKRVFVPLDNASEGSVVEGIDVFGIAHIDELISFLLETTTLEPLHTAVDLTKADPFAPDFSEVKGQFMARRALEIAAAGGHNVLLIGPPGSGKSMLAKRLPSILPQLSLAEAIETTSIHSIAGLLTSERPFIANRPFRAPHHSVSAAGLAGGCAVPRPGEISLAHNGVLFLDELPEFRRDVKEVLRQPLEDGVVSISRASGTLSYPCSMMVVAAMNPCPCGYFGHPTKECTCSSRQVSSYLSKVSGPLLDRLDLHIEAIPVAFEELASKQKAESSDQIRVRVNAARKRQEERYQHKPYHCNARIAPGDLQQMCTMTDDAVKRLRTAFELMGLSARAYDRVIKVARTIADLEGEDVITDIHITEAVQYRSLDRKYWKQQMA